MKTIKINSKTKTISIVVLFLTLFILTGCSDQKIDSLSKDYIVKEATNVAVEYVKNHQKKDVVFPFHEFNEKKGKSLIVLQGYDIRNPEQKLEMVIDYNHDFRIIQ